MASVSGTDDNKTWTTTTKNTFLEIACPRLPVLKRSSSFPPDVFHFHDIAGVAESDDSTGSEIESLVETECTRSGCDTESPMSLSDGHQHVFAQVGLAQSFETSTQMRHLNVKAPLFQPKALQ